MRKKEKEITKQSEIEAVIHQSRVFRLGLSDDDMPYIVPLCFGYQDQTIYVHGSYKGRKVDILRKNPMVCFEFDINTAMVEADNACEWGMTYQSVIGFGHACFIEDPNDKRKALTIIMNQYSDRRVQFPDNIIHKTAVIKIDITGMTGKQSGFN